MTYSYKFTLRLLSLSICFTSVNPISAELSSQGESREILQSECEKALIDFPNLKSISRRTEIYRTKAGLINNIESWAKVFYEGRGFRAYNKLHLLGDQFTKLLVDPGIVMRLEEFIRFVRDNNLKKEDPWEIREKFSKHLGNKTVYRSISVDKEKVKNLFVEGLSSDLLRESNLLEDIYSFNGFGKPVRRPRHSINELFWYRSSSNSNPIGVSHSPILSVTNYPDVADAVAFSFLKEGQSLIRARLSIPVLDIVYPNAGFGIGPEYAVAFMMTRSRIFYEVVPVGKTPYTIPGGGPKLESFVFYAIQPEEIVSLSVVKKEEVGYIASETRIMRTYTGCFGNCPKEIRKKIEGPNYSED